MLKIIKLGNSIYENIEPFTINEDGEKVWNISSDIAELKTVFIDTIKWQAGLNLKETDWVVTKCMELGLVIADEYPTIYADRTALRKWSNDKELKAKDCSTVEELIALDIKI